MSLDRLIWARWRMRLPRCGGYALVGMAAATAATTHAPLMAAVMVFERLNCPATMRLPYRDVSSNHQGSSEPEGLSQPLATPLITAIRPPLERA